MKRIITILFLSAVCHACGSDRSATVTEQEGGKDDFAIAIAVETTSTTATVKAAPNDADADYTVFVVEADKYRPSNTPCDAVEAKGAFEHTFAGLAADKDYVAVADAALRGYRTTVDFHTEALPNQGGSGETGGWRLVWEDSFDGESLSTDTWNYEVNGNGNGNAELQYYRAENVAIESEPSTGRRCMTITARKEDYGQRKFTSGRINSMGKFYFCHGKIEAYIMLPETADGLWPAFWMMGNDFQSVGWPRCGEIDILEMGNAEGIAHGTQETFFNGACHWGFYNENGQYPNYARSSNAPYSLQDGAFHLFTCIWDEQNVSMYLDLDRNPDAEPYYQMGISDTDGDWAAGRYFHKDCFILFNLAVGGYFTGLLSPERITAFNDKSEAKMYVDYVRVYQKQ